MAFKVFDFYCMKCNHQEEQMVQDDRDGYCSKCGQKMQRLLSAPGMVRTNCNDKPGFAKRLVKRVWGTD